MTIIISSTPTEREKTPCLSLISDKKEILQLQRLPTGFLRFDHHADQASVAGHIVKHDAAIGVTTHSDVPDVIVRGRRCGGYVDDERSREVLSRFLCRI